ncbi:MAG TPA: M23 family metallopeptidase [Methylomirabilota bacterium]|nr:M23 family metallopeptidase [Methylomirabilota bacterium]
MARIGARFWFYLVLLPALLIVVGISILAWRQTVHGVHAEIVPPLRFIGVKTPLNLSLRAERGSVLSVEVRLVQGQGRVVLAAQTFAAPGPEKKVDLVVEGRNTGLREGQATLEVRARDSFWRPLRVDDRPVLTVPVTLDFTPPTLEVLSYTRYLAQGGGGLVVFRSKGASRVGVNAGGLFFPAFPAGPPDSGILVGLLALPWDAPRGAISVLAQDEAGNAVTRPVAAEIKARKFPTDAIEVKEAFLKEKVAELLPDQASAQGEALVAAFLRINRDQRKAAEQKKRELATRTQPRPLFEGPFLQPHNSKVFSNFAETRSYRYEGREIDVQVHLGYDLASLKHSPVPAANSGIVLYAGPLTIYGNAVILDHGWGLQTLYAHLSSFSVKEGDSVQKGQELGRTGTTGLAVGDHLHYEVLIHGISVTPIEWWDARWIRDHIGKPLRDAGLPTLVAGTQPAAGEEEQAPVKRRSRARGR